MQGDDSLHLHGLDRLELLLFPKGQEVRQEVEPSLKATDLGSLLDRLSIANIEFADRYPGIQVTRKPVHTLYGGAHLYRAGIANKLGGLALKHFETYARDHQELADALAINTDGARSESPGIWSRVYERTLTKLREEPVEDQRVDLIPLSRSSTMAHTSRPHLKVQQSSFQKTRRN
jgi:hypothetical protein